MTRTQLLAYALAIALALPFAAAFHRIDPPIASGSAAGPGWASVAFTSTGGELDVEIEATGASPVGGGVVLYQDGQALFMLTLASLAGHTGILVDSRAAPGSPITHEIDLAGSPGEGFMGAAITISGLQPGSYAAAVFAAGDVSSWGWAARGSATPTGLASGSGAWLATDREFTGAANAQAFAQGLGGRANVATTFDVSTVNGLTGIYYWTFYTSQNAMTAETPEGTQVCTCVFFDSPPGDYSMTLTGAGAGLEGLTSVIFIGADIGLPIA